MSSESEDRIFGLGIPHNMSGGEWLRLVIEAEKMGVSLARQMGELWPDPAWKQQEALHGARARFFDAIRQVREDELIARLEEMCEPPAEDGKAEEGGENGTP